MTWNSVEPTYEFDPFTQHEVILDRITAESFVMDLELRRFAGDSTRVIWLRMLGRLPEAAELGWRVLARTGGPATAGAIGSSPLELWSVTAAVRLANVLQWQEEFTAAHELIARAITTIDAVSPSSEDAAYAEYLLPYVYLHSARCFYDQHDFTQALADAMTCLQLRRDAGVSAKVLTDTVDFIVETRTRLGLDFDLDTVPNGPTMGPA